MDAVALEDEIIRLLALGYEERIGILNQIIQM